MFYLVVLFLIYSYNKFGDFMSRTKGKRFADKHEQKRLKKKNQIFQDDTNLNEKKSKKKKNKLFYNIIIIICLCVIAYSLYNIIKWAIENKQNNDLLADVQNLANIKHEEVVIDDNPITVAHYDFTELLKKNVDTVGWVYVPNSKIDYPVVQTTNNDYYLNHSFDRKENSAGWVFADTACDVKTSKNVVIYGHNRKDTSMFGSLKNVFEDSWISVPENNYITFANLDETGVYKIFSAFVVNDEHVESYLNCNFKSDEEFKAYLKKIKSSGNQSFDTDIENAEKIITLYTCYGMNNQRLLVFAVKVL